MCQCPLQLQFPLPNVVIAAHATLHHQAFCIQGSGVPITCCGTRSSSMHIAHIALEKCQVVTLTLYKMAFCLSNKVVAFYLDNSTAKAYLCNQGGTTSLFLSTLACYILSLADKHGYCSDSSICTYPSQCGSQLSQGKLVPKCQLLLGIAQAAFIIGVNLGWICWHPSVPINVFAITPCNVLHLWGHWG